MYPLLNVERLKSIPQKYWERNRSGGCCSRLRRTCPAGGEQRLKIAASKKVFCNSSCHWQGQCTVREWGKWSDGEMIQWRSKFKSRLTAGKVQTEAESWSWWNRSHSWVKKYWTWLVLHMQWKEKGSFIVRHKRHKRKQNSVSACTVRRNREQSNFCLDESEPKWYKMWKSAHGCVIVKIKILPVSFVHDDDIDVIICLL